MNALNLAVEDRVGIHAYAERRTQPVREAPSGAALRLADGTLVSGIAGERPQLRELTEIRDPATADRLGDGGGKRRIVGQQPAPRCYAVGLVAEALGEELGEVLDSHRAQQM